MIYHFQLLVIFGLGTYTNPPLLLSRLLRTPPASSLPGVKYPPAGRRFTAALGSRVGSKI